MRRLTWLLSPAVVALILGGGQAEAGYITLAPPEAVSTQAGSVSGGNVVGGYTTAFGAYPLLYNGTTHTYTTLAPPGATGGIATGVSGGNVVGGYTTVFGTIYGFLYNGTTYTTLAVPGAVSTEANGVSGSNVVGDYYSGGITYGFLYVPEPSGLVLLGIGFATTAGYLGLRRANKVQGRI